jgi:hypothetical protein
MESKAFHICPFCQAQNPASVSRCTRCDRSLAGLPLPVYGSELDAEMRPHTSADLVDLPLRDTMADAPPPDDPPVSAVPPAPDRAPRRASLRRRDGRTARLGVVAGLMGLTGLLGAAVLVGGWLVRAQDRDKPEEAEITPAASATTVPLPTVPPVTAAPALPRAKPAAPRTVVAAAPPPAQAASHEEPPPPPVAYPQRPARRPAAEVILPPDVAAAPVDVERARDDVESEAPAESVEAGARAALRARLDRAREHRDAVAARVRELRERTNVPVIKDVEEYQRVQEQLSTALDELDRADAEVLRLRRALRRRAE